MSPDELLVLADHLARLEKGRPKKTSLRRAVSTAYYAVFHQMAYLCANELVGWNNPWSMVSPVYRALNHAMPRKLFAKDRNGSLLGVEIRDILGAFTKLQEARHTADYDPEPYGPRRGEALELIDQARRTVKALRSLPPDKKKLLAVHLIAKPR
ncbi:hypothetical protein [Blastochloris sulfoviridis]|uniref:HEPN domain-containing protein n=1 Tax=Blastochloris sulfoviridis TaxID=50712 RepID=A0A5M6I215_9HYPH|nr:hypothetical protein [Blastochloris sulfoviridis]KAA5601848.1 hypothetical protein F1193_07925 [Blastochloris sulfoviridis]